MAEVPAEKVIHQLAQINAQQAVDLAAARALLDQTRGEVDELRAQITGLLDTEDVQPGL